MRCPRQRRSSSTIGHEILVAMPTQEEFARSTSAACWFDHEDSSGPVCPDATQTSNLLLGVDREFASRFCYLQHYRLQQRPVA